MRKMFLNFLVVTSIISLVLLSSCDKKDEPVSEKPDITGEKGTLTDIDDNTYNWIGIGKQAWMTENLKVIHEQDGTAIPLVESDTEWVDLGDNNTDKAYCYYSNSADSLIKYGALYTYAAAKDACPTGWHLPTDAEWTELSDYIAGKGHSETEGTVLKSKMGWYNNGNGTDDYGFSALPGGYRLDNDGLFYNVGGIGLWWSSTEDGSSGYSYARHLDNNNSIVNRDAYSKSRGFSVRCVRDN